MSSSLFWSEEPISLFMSPYYELQWLAERAGVSVETLCQTVEAATQFARDSQHKSNFIIPDFEDGLANTDLEDVGRVLSDDFGNEAKAVWVESQHPRDKEGKFSRGTIQSRDSVSNTSKKLWRRLLPTKLDELVPSIPHPFLMEGPEVSKGLELIGEANHLQRVVDAIDRVHGDGALPRIPVDLVDKFDDDTRTREYQGRFNYNSETGEAKGIQIRSGGDAPELATLHEIAHFIDFKGLEAGNSGTSIFSSKRLRLQDPIDFTADDFQELHDALTQSASYEKLMDYRKRNEVKTTKKDGGLTYKVDRDLVEYLSSPEELFARAYCQYVATRSGDETLRRQIAVTLLPGRMSSIGDASKDSLRYPEYWSPKDFEPIGKAFDNLFKKQGWLA